LKYTNGNGQEMLINTTQVEVHSLLGDKVSYELNNNNIDITNQANGIYFISVKQDTQIINFKIVKQ
jgi:alanine-alpha-ketoisovalerate/valine-pyruvate aminotransferase